MTLPLRFLRLRLNRGRYFDKDYVLNLDRDRTIIAGYTEGIYQALAAPGVNNEVKGILEVEGDAGLVDKYRAFIFLSHYPDPVFINRDGVFTPPSEIPIVERKEMERYTTQLYELILHGRIGSCTKSQLFPIPYAGWSVGEKQCFVYAMAFAARVILRLDVPIVMESPFGVLDDSKRQCMKSFLDKQSCQQIWVLGRGESRGIEATYTVNYDRRISRYYIEENTMGG